MTEPTPIHLGKPVCQVEQTVDGLVPAPAGLGESTAAAGLEVKARSQWSYARKRFFRHRLAMTGLVLLVIIFGAGVFANFIAPYSFSEIDLNNILAPPTTVG